MSIPKKPLAVSRAKKKLPVELDWGPGIPKDRLRYINAKEEALIKRFRTTKAARDYAGITAYPDPGDTAAGEKGIGGTNTSKTTGGGSTDKGGKGQGGQSKGPSGAGQGPNSSPSRSTGASSPKSSSSPTGGGSKSPSGPSAASSGPSKAPNAAAQAASNSYRGAQSSRTNAQSSVSTSKAPNAAAAYASQKLNATSNALKTAQQPKSIQGMINSGTATAWGGRPSTAPQTAPNGSYYGPKGITSLNRDARMAAARSVGFNPAPVQRTPGDAEAMGRMMMAESATIRNNYGNPSVPGLMGVGEVVRNRMLSERFPDTVQSVISQRKQFSPWGDGSYARTPANAMATSIAESILSGESPPTVGTSLNYGNIDTINNKPGYSSRTSKSAFNSMPVEARIADARNPNTFSHTFGTIGAPSDVAFNGTDTPSYGSRGLTAATTDLAAERPQAIPAPSSVGILGTYNQPPAPSRTTVAGDPRVSMPPGAYPAAGPTLPTRESMLPPPIDRPQGPLQPPSQNMQTPPGWGQERVLGVENYVDTSGIRDPAAARMSGLQPPQASPSGPLPSSLPGFNPPGLPSNFRGTAGVASTGRVPGWGYSPSADYSTPSAGPTVTADNTDSYAPQEDSSEQDVPYSDSPIQGPSNPMQEGPQVEDPGVTKQRQTKYASRGATVGGIIAGPIGTIIGGTLGWQMGKTTPGQRKAIASSPRALNANVQSINQMVEERGGKGNPDMQVTPRGFRDVLINPAQVSASPEKYTTLEQMLAALAQGIDPETGKPIA